MDSLSEVLRRTFAAPSEVTADDLPTLRQLHLGGTSARACRRATHCAVR
ncbi:hypothetical protein [Deinococcus radiodurans]|nr:hypothetical protein [Deinococcus radiodurans]UTA52483.1 hypothetical protein MSS93_17500 [Deinococcus radiodurans]